MLNNWNTKIYRCKYCRCILGDYMRGKLYCSEWCREMGEDQAIAYHKCKYCDKGTSPYIRSDGRKTGIYRKVCDECFENKLYLKKPRASRAKPKVIDLIGHLCKKCGEYKTWDNFYTTNGKKSTKCMLCSNKANRDWYNKNLELNRERSHNYYLKKKQNGNI